LTKEEMTSEQQQQQQQLQQQELEQQQQQQQSQQQQQQQSRQQQQNDKPHKVRVWADGCWDMWHYGHANALRQAKSCGDILVVGVHSDDEIKKHKGIPVIPYEERVAVVSACKWVDEVVLDAPYETVLATLYKWNIDFCVHGEDISTTADGTDSFTEVKAAGKFKLIKRTDTISTTDLLGRLLLMTKHHLAPDHRDNNLSFSSCEGRSNVKQFLATSRKIVQFSTAKIPQPNDRIVYCDGSFDLFHAGHVEFLQQAKTRGDFLIVGIYADQDVNCRLGVNYPIMNLHERALTVLSCKYVDEVIIGTPVHISSYMIDSLKINTVVRNLSDSLPLLPEEPDPYKEPKERGIYEEIFTRSKTTTKTILKRIILQRLEFEERNTKKVLKDNKINESITFLPAEL